MKPFDIDWAEFIERLAVWERLSLPARAALVELKSGQGKEVREFDGYAPDLVEAGSLSYYAEGQRVRLAKEFSPFSRALRAMARHDILGNPGNETLYAYLREHFTARQITELTPRDCRYSYGNMTHLLRVTTSVEWLEQLLAAENYKYLEQPGGVFGQLLFDEPGVFEALQQVIGQFKTSDRSVPLGDLPDRFSAFSLGVLGKVILAGIRHLFLFPAMRPDDKAPVMALWPAITERLHRPQLGRPKRIQPDETYHSALMVDDITSILVAAASRPLRIRANDGALFAKVQQEIESNLVSTPDWIAGLQGYSPSERIGSAMRLLRSLEYVRMAGRAGKDLSLQATGRGADWLAANSKDRLMDVLDQLNPDKSKSRKKKRAPAVDAYDDFGTEVIDRYDSYRVPYSFDLIPSHDQITNCRDWNPLASLAKAFGTLRDNRFVLIEQFLDWHSQQYNPLLQLQAEGMPLEFFNAWSIYHPSEEEIEVYWWNLLADFTLSRLFPLGGLQMGIGQNGDKSFALTDAGRYLLGLVEDFDYGLKQKGDHPILVQPNFEVVFTSPSPQAEASIGRFAQRKGHRVGTLFRITKQSILAAACTGMTAQQALDTLRSITAKAIPANVEREIQGWFDQCRRVTVRHAILVDCPDAQTAARVLAAGGKKATAMTDTVIELAGSKRDAALFRKLDAMGIFAGPSKPPAKRSSKKRPRRRG